MIKNTWSTKRNLMKKRTENSWNEKFSKNLYGKLMKNGKKSFGVKNCQKSILEVGVNAHQKKNIKKKEREVERRKKYFGG